MSNQPVLQLQNGLVRMNVGLATVSNQPVAKPAATVRTTGIGLTTVSNQPVVKLRTSLRDTSLGLTTVSNQSVVKPDALSAHQFSGLTTVTNQSVVKPMRANPQTRCRIGRLNQMIKRRYSCFATQDGVPVRSGSPQALIPVPTTVQLALARRTYVTPSVAYAGNSNPLCHV